jgi:DNA gyrase subunit A
LVKLGPDDRVIGTLVASSPEDSLIVKTNMGGEQRINAAKYEVTTRGGRGREIIKRGKLTEVVRPPVTAPEPFERAES